MYVFNYITAQWMTYRVFYLVSMYRISHDFLYLFVLFYVLLFSI